MFSLQTQGVLRRVASSSLRICPACRNYSSLDPSPATKNPPNRPRRTVFSGIQPTGVPHLGNYLGALKQWVKLQNDAKPKDKLLFSVVDLHAVTVKQNPRQLAQWRKEMFAALLAVGLDPERSVIFAQGDSPHHSELMWILSCNASMGYLGRMTQWKSKLALADDASPLDPSPSNKAALKLGLFSYPVLQAADILLYGTTHVPVGEDQSQHIEFTREVAIGFNHAFHHPKAPPLLVPPETILSPAKRVMSLTNPTKKMSKSDPDPGSRILITDSKEEIQKKINSARTDSIQGISYDRTLRPGVSNLIDILYYMNEDGAESPEQLAKELSSADTSMKALKEKVADSIDGNIREVREKYQELMSGDQKKLVDTAMQGARSAKKISGKKLNAVKKAMGLKWYSEHGKKDRKKRGEKVVGSAPTDE